MQAFNVYLRRKWIDTVFYSDGARVDCEEVRQSLINHDGYHPSIRVTKARKRTKPPEVAK